MKSCNRSRGHDITERKNFFNITFDLKYEIFIIYIGIFISFNIDNDLNNKITLFIKYK